MEALSLKLKFLNFFEEIDFSKFECWPTKDVWKENFN